MKLIGLAAAVLALASAQANAQSYPSKPIRVLIPLAAGSAVDIAARIIVPRMSETLGQPMVIENLSGAAGMIGTERGAKAAPDGYTLLFVNDSVITMVPNLQPKVTYDSLRDFAPISQVAAITFTLVAHPSVPATTVNELVTYAKSRPGQINYSSGGNGSPQHLAMEMFKTMTGTELVHVPYKGATPALNDVVAGQVPVMFTGLSLALSFIKDNRLRLIGISGPKRTSVMPEVPTIAESVAGFEFQPWTGLLAPAGTPPEIIAKLHAAAIGALNRPEVRTRLAELGFEIIGNSPAEFTEVIRTDFAKMARVVKESGAKID